MKQICRNCRWWKELSDSGGYVDAIGSCHKNSPRPFFLEDFEEDNPCVAWPDTVAAEWCGDWMGKKGSFGENEYVGSKAAADELGVLVGTLLQVVHQGKIPRPRRLDGGNVYLWGPNDIEAARRAMRPQVTKTTKSASQGQREKANDRH